MGMLVCNGALCKCSFGDSSTPLTVLPDKMTNSCSKPVASVMDSEPGTNIAPFGACTAPGNPATKNPTGKGPCSLKLNNAQWTPGSPAVVIGGQPALSQNSTLVCEYGGVISINAPGQVTVQCP